MSSYDEMHAAMQQCGVDKPQIDQVISALSERWGGTAQYFGKKTEAVEVRNERLRRMRRRGAGIGDLARQCGGLSERQIRRILG